MTGYRARRNQGPPPALPAPEYGSTPAPARPAEQLAERINAAIGTITPIDDGRCLLDTGADSVEALAVRLGLLGVDVTVTQPAELVELMRTLAGRYHRATATG